MVHTGPIEDWYWQYIGTLKYTVLIHLVQLRCTILIADRYTGFPFRAVSPDTGSTYRSDRIPVRGPPAIGRYRRNRSLPTQERGDASSPRAGQGAASSYIGRMRRCLVFQRENEASPRLPTGNEASPRSLTTLFSPIDTVYLSIPSTIPYRDQVHRPRPRVARTPSPPTGHKRLRPLFLSCEEMERLPGQGERSRRRSVPVLTIYRYTGTDR
ncbi:hypothetical protein BHE74_00056536 [Ensete ventricosum]|nr:hypothetical protein BHE74_00056536 [Ensete ventricosum]